MDEKNLKQQILHHLAEQGVPAAYNPWEAVQKRLRARQEEQGSARGPFQAALPAGRTGGRGGDLDRLRYLPIDTPRAGHSQ